LFVDPVLGFRIDIGVTHRFSRVKGDHDMTKRSSHFRVGLLTLLGVTLFLSLSILLQNRPFWWKPCQLVHISVSDATGIRKKSAVRSLGIDIGYLKSVSLGEDQVELGICLTAPVTLLESTRAYLRSEGLLGDKFIELKPVHYEARQSFLDLWVPEASAADPEKKGISWASDESRAIPMGAEAKDLTQIASKLDELMERLNRVTSSVDQAIEPDALKQAVKQLNETLSHASKTFAPESGLNQTAQRTLAKLEDAVDQLRDMVTRVNRGEGSVGMLLNDSSVAGELKAAITNINKLLAKAQHARFNLDLGAMYLGGFHQMRSAVRLSIYPKPDRYYSLGIAFDPRGKVSNRTIITQAGGQSSEVSITTRESTSFLITALLGKILFERWDLQAGLMFGDGFLGLGYFLGTHEEPWRYQFRSEVYARSGPTVADVRAYFQIQPFPGLFHALVFRAGVDAIRFQPKGLGWMAGAALNFDDQDIKILFSLR
jgi:phospholipid/cholesterol/gamma-HCH transport system substrate-binding protein